MIDTIEIQINQVAQSNLPNIDFNNIQFGRSYSDHMFSADFENGEWSNLRIVPYSNLSLSPANVTLHYGQSVFEGMKAYKNSSGEVLLFRPHDNCRRLQISAERMCLEQVPEEIFMGGLVKLLQTDQEWVPDIAGTSLYIRPFLFATDEYIGIRPSKSFKFLIFTSPVGAYYSDPVRVKVETEFVRAAPGGTGYAKAAGNYGGSLYPAKLAQEQGYHQLIWTDAIEHKYIEESGTMNVMFLIGNSLVTAATSDTILNGITRDSVLQLARDFGYNVEERKVSVEEVIGAIHAGDLKEAFGAGTAAAVAPIEAIGYDGTDYELPRDFSLSAKLKAELEGIKTGAIADRHNWTYKV